MSVLAVVIIVAFFALFFIFVFRDLDELAHEQLLDELWSDEVDGGRSASGRVRTAAVDDLGGAA